MTKRLGLLLLVLPTLLPTVVAGCADAGGKDAAAEVDELRGLSKNEALSDLNQIGELIRSYYGPLEYKKAKFNFDLDQALAAGRAQIEAGQNEGDRVRAFYTLLAQLRDGHVSLQYGMRGDESPQNSLFFIVMPIEQTYVVAGVAQGLAIGRGDELVSIDGLTPKQMADLITPFQTIATPESTAHGVAASMTFRPFYAPKELAPRGATAQCVFKKADGSQYEVAVPWQTTPGGIAGQIQPPTPAADPPPAPPPANGDPPNAQAALKKLTLVGRDAAFSSQANWIIRRDNPQASVLQVASTTPFYFTPAVTTQYAPVEVAPKAETLAKYGVTLPAADAPTAADYIHLKAFKYKHAGKTVMIVRIPEYIVPQDNYEENVAWVSALIEENAGTAAAAPPPADLASTPADVIVLDDTHNPGGSATYVHGLASLFLKAPSGIMVQANHSDRKWFEGYVALANQINAIPGFPPEFVQTLMTRSGKVEEAFDTGKWLAPFMPLTGANLGPNAEFTAESFFGAELLKPHPLGHWEKPVLVLHDELSGSGGDAFPAILQNSGIKTFGARTMGLGGTVEPVGQLSNSRATLNLTRGIFGIYQPNGAPPKLVENLGVTPDYAYAHTVADFRAGYAAYVKAFSDIAVGMTGERKGP
jgi:hypothetical protein